MERLRDGETVICAEGYLFVFERRGYLTAGSFVPEVILEHPELVRQQYEEFVHAGSDVVLAFTVSICMLPNQLIDAGRGRTRHGMRKADIDELQFWTLPNTSCIQFDCTVDS